MKGVIEEFLEHIGMKKKAEYDPNAQKPWLHPGRQANVVYDGTVIGYLGEVHPKVMANYGIGQRTYVAVLDMPAVDGILRPQVRGHRKISCSDQRYQYGCTENRSGRSD